MHHTIRLCFHDSTSLLLFRVESNSSPFALEYQIDLASYFRLSDTTIDESSQAKINIDDDVCEFTLQGSGLEDHEIKVVVSFRAALKIYDHTERTSAMQQSRRFKSPLQLTLRMQA